MFSGKIHHIIYIASTALIAIGLPVSPFLLSLGILLLALNWLLEGKFRSKYHALRKSKAVLGILLIYGVHLIGLIYTSNYDYALHDLRIKLPLLALPILYGSSSALSHREFKLILNLLLATVFVATLISTYIILGLSGSEITDAREASPFISHIRFALIILVCLSIIFYYSVLSPSEASGIERRSYLTLGIWLICYLFLLKAFTGLVILLLVTPFSISWLIRRFPGKAPLRLFYGLSLLIVVGVLTYGIYSYKRFNQRLITETQPYEQYTPSGNTYSHIEDSDAYENGHRVWIYVCYDELEQEWNKRSSIAFGQTDMRGQDLRTTLIRYMSSLGLRKDSAGVTQLNSDDIRMIENGYPNAIFKKKFSLYPRIYQLLWEIEWYNSTGDPNGLSLIQRMVYVQTGWKILKSNPMLGVGTGDIDDAFKRQYLIDDTRLNRKLQHRTHNQFLTFLITFGISGTLIILFALFYPPVRLKANSSYLFSAFFLIALLSMLSEDTLETHVGASMFAFLYAFYLFAMPSKNTPEDASSQ